MPITKDDLSRLFNCRLELTDEKDVLVLQFSKEGYVAVTMGVKDGPIAGPMMYWSLTGQGHLRVTQQRMNMPWRIEKPFLEMTGIQFNEDTLRVETIKGPQVYIIETLSEINKA